MDRKSKLFSALLISSSAMALLPAMPVFAQAVPDSSASAAQVPVANDEIIVTANRRRESLQDVPVAITALPRSHLETANITTTLDLPKLTPSLQIVQVGAFSMPRIRGVGTSGNSPTSENPVATYVDGVYYASQSSAVLSLSNIDQVEIDKGPQGTLFGRNATGGLIQIKTRDPRSKIGGDASVAYENYNTVLGNVYLTGPIADDLAADIAIYYRNQGEGYGRNILTDQDINLSDNLVVRSKWKYERDGTSVTLIGDYQLVKGAFGQSPAPGTVPPGGLLPLRGQDTAVPARYRNRAEQGGLSLAIAQDLGSVDLMSITAYRKFKDFNAFPNVTSSVAALTTVALDSEVEQVSQELQLQSEAGGRLSWTAGLFLFYHRGGWLPTVIGGTPLAPLEALVFNTEQKTYSIAGYGQGTYQLGDSTRLTLGLRYTNDRRKWDYNLDIRAPFPIPPATDAEKRTFRKLTWRAVLDHRLSREILAYASVNRGFKSGGFNDFNSPAIIYLPEVLDAYEVGLKTELADNALRLNVAAFIYDYKNIQVNRYQGGVQVLYNGASAEVKGLELEGAWNITERLQLGFGLSVLDSRYKSFPNADITTPAAAGGTIITMGSATGNDLNATPDWTGSVSASYTIPTSSGDLTLAGSYYHNDGFVGSPDERIRQGAYDLLDANLSFETTDRAWRLSLFGRNLTSERYAAFIYAQANGDAVSWASPRTYGAKIEYRF